MTPAPLSASCRLLQLRAVWLGRIRLLMRFSLMSTSILLEPKIESCACGCSSYSRQSLISNRTTPSNHTRHTHSHTPSLTDGQKPPRLDSWPSSLRPAARDTTVFLFPHAPPSLFRGKTTEGVAGSVAVRVGGAALLRSRGKFVDDARTPAAREALVLACLRHLVAVARKVGRHAGVL